MSGQQLLPVERMTDFERFQVGIRNRIGVTLKSDRFGVFHDPRLGDWLEKPPPQLVDSDANETGDSLASATEFLGDFQLRCRRRGSGLLPPRALRK